MGESYPCVSSTARLRPLLRVVSPYYVPFVDSTRRLSILCAARADYAPAIHTTRHRSWLRAGYPCYASSPDATRHLQMLRVISRYYAPAIHATRRPGLKRTRSAYLSELAVRPAAAEISPAARVLRILVEGPCVRGERHDGGSGFEQPLPREILEEGLGGEASALLGGTRVEIAAQGDDHGGQRGPGERQDHPERRQVDVDAERHKGGDRRAQADDQERIAPCPDGDREVDDGDEGRGGNREIPEDAAPRSWTEVLEAPAHQLDQAEVERAEVDGRIEPDQAHDEDGREGVAESRRQTLRVREA